MDALKQPTSKESTLEKFREIGLDLLRDANIKSQTIYQLQKTAARRGFEDRHIIYHLAKDYLSDGKSAIDMTHICDVAKPTLEKIFAAVGIPKRTPKEARKINFENRRGWDWETTRRYPGLAAEAAAKAALRGKKYK